MAAFSLDYGHAPHRGRRAVRGILIAIIGLATIVCAPVAWDRIQFAYVRRNCLAYIAEPDRVVYEEDPAAKVKLLSHAGYTIFARWGSAGGSAATIEQPVAAQCPKHLEAFLNAASIRLGSPSRSGVVGFVGVLKTPSGIERLVVVELCAPAHHSVATAYTMDPGPIFGPSPSVLKTSGSSFSWFEMLSWTWGFSTLYKPQNARIYAGQVDPADPSRFTIRYQAWGNENFIDGWIDNQDNVTIRARGM